MGKGTGHEVHHFEPLVSRSVITTCFFDLDDTLYPLSTGIAAECRKNIKDTMVKVMGFSADTVDAENIRLYKGFGTTMAGLRAEGHSFSFDEWHKHVHAPLPYDLIRPDPELRRTLHSMPQRKFIFTNADRAHAARCLSRLGVEDCLHGVIAFEDIQEASPIRCFEDRDTLPWEEDSDGRTVAEKGREMSREGIVKSWQSPAGPKVCCKPQVEAFYRALSLADADPHHSIMFEDSAANITGAKRVGMRTCMVGSTKHIAAADYCVASIHNIHAAVPELWEGLEIEECGCPCGQSPMQAVQA